MENTSNDNRLAVRAVIIEEAEAAGAINALLHEHESMVMGRMGLPFRNRGVNIISLVLDAPQDRINTLAGALGRIPGVTAKAVYGRK
jgi:putative iron-only hydrogenase system regulator